jgi:predicted transcriptional regulator
MELENDAIWKAMKVLSNEGTMIVFKTIYSCERHRTTISDLVGLHNVAEESILQHLNILESVELVGKVNNNYYVTVFGELILHSILQIQSEMWK